MLRKMRIIGIICLVVALSCCMVLSGCATKENSEIGEENDKLKVVAVNFPAYDFARQIAGDDMDVSMLLPPGTESHSFEPTPQNIIDIGNADLFIYNGGESDNWVTQILDAADNPNLVTLSMMEQVTVVDEEMKEGMQAEEVHEHSDDEGGEDVEKDEHVWMDPQNARKIVDAIAEEMGKIDPQRKEIYTERVETYSAKLQELDDNLHAMADGAVRKTIIVGDRFPFRYLTDALGLDYYAAFPGCSTEVEPSAATVAFLIDKVKDEKIPVVFGMELSNGKMADTICESTDAVKMTLNSAHNVSKEDFESGVTYIDIMNQNMAALKEALY